MTSGPTWSPLNNTRFPHISSIKELRNNKEFGANDGPVLADALLGQAKR